MITFCTQLKTALRRNRTKTAPNYFYRSVNISFLNQYWNIGNCLTEIFSPLQNYKSDSSVATKIKYRLQNIWRKHENSIRKRHLGGWHHRCDLRNRFDVVFLSKFSVNRAPGAQFVIGQFFSFCETDDTAQQFCSTVPATFTKRS